MENNLSRRKPHPASAALRACAALLAVAAICAHLPARYARAQDQERTAAGIVRDGNEHFKAGRYDDAAKAYRKSLTLQQDPGVWFNLGLALAALQRLDEARDALSWTLRLKPDFPGARRQLGLILYEQRQWEQSARELSAALCAGADATAWRVLASALEQIGDEGSAQHALRMAVMSEPDDASLRAALASSLHRSGRITEAVAEYRLALKRSPADPRLRRGLGFCLLAGSSGRDAQAEEALDELETAARLGADDASLWSALADVYAGMDMSRESAAAFARAMKIRGATPEDLFRLGSLHHRSGDFEPARANYLETLKISQGHSRAMHSLGTLLLTQGDHAAAIAWFEKLAQTGRMQAEAWSGIGDCSFSAGDPSKAASAYEKALAFSSGDGRVWRALGHARFAQERWADAARAYRRALEFEPGDRESAAYLAAAENSARGEN